MIYKHTEEQLQYYFMAPALNQSGIKVILKDGIQKFVEIEEDIISKEDLYYEEKEHFVIGSAVDHIITQGMETFRDKYAYSVLTNKPPDTVMSIVKQVFDKIPPEEAKVEDLGFYMKQLYDSCNEHSYYMNRKVPSDKLIKGQPDERTWKDDKRVIGFMGDGTVQQYWKELIDSQGKQLLSEYEQNKILQVSGSILNHKHTKDLFKDGGDIDIIYQMPLFFDFNGVNCKALPDMIKVNHKAKRILLIDIKTMGDYVLRFNQQLRIRRYDIQGSFYLLAIRMNLGTIGELIGKDISKYELANPAFIVESTTRPGTPMICVMTDDLVEMGIVGGDKSYVNGYFQGVDIYKEWKELNYSIEERFRETNGVVWIDGQFEYNETF